MTHRGRGHGRGQGRRQENDKDVNDLTTMVARVDAIEATKRRGTAQVIREDNDDDEELETIIEEHEEQMTMEETMIKFISNIGSKPKLDTHVYSGSLNSEELIVWIGEMETNLWVWID